MSGAVTGMESKVASMGFPQGRVKRAGKKMKKGTVSNRSAETPKRSALRSEKHQPAARVKPGGGSKLRPRRVGKRDGVFGTKSGLSKGQKKKRFSVVQPDEEESSADDIEVSEEGDLDSDKETLSSAAQPKRAYQRHGVGDGEGYASEDDSSGGDTDQGEGEEGDEDEDNDDDDDVRESYTGADWLADDDEEAWSSASEDEGAFGESKTTGKKSLTVREKNTLEENPEVSREFQRILGQRLLKDREFLDFLVKESEKGFGASSVDDGDEEDMTDDEEESEEDEEEPGDTPTGDDDGKELNEVEKKKNVLSLERYEHLCHAAGLLPPAQTPDATGSSAVVPTPSLRSLQLILAAFRSAARQTAVPPAPPTAPRDKLGNGTNERLESNKKYKNSKKQGDKAEGDGHARTSGNQRDSGKSRGEGAARKCLFRIDDEDLRHVILLRTVQGFPQIISRLLKASRGDEKTVCSEGKTSVDARNVKGLGLAEDGDALSLSATTEHPLWSRLRLPFRWFFSDLYELLSTLQSLSQSATRGKDLLLQVLLATAQKTLMGLVVVIGGGICRRLLRAVARCWAFTANQKQQLAAFVVLRQLLTLQQALLAEHMLKGAVGEGKKKGGGRGGEQGGRGQRAALSAGERLQHTVQLLLRAYQQAASRSVGSSGGRSWRSSNRLQLLLNELQELLRDVDANVSYRVAYQSVREVRRSSMEAWNQVASVFFGTLSIRCLVVCASGIVRRVSESVRATLCGCRAARCF